MCFLNLSFYRWKWRLIFSANKCFTTEDFGVNLYIFRLTSSSLADDLPADRGNWTLSFCRPRSPARTLYQTTKSGYYFRKRKAKPWSKKQMFAFSERLTFVGYILICIHFDWIETFLVHAPTCSECYCIPCKILTWFDVCIVWHHFTSWCNF